MSQNRSHAVMAQRIEPHDSLDDFPTPPWATRALMTHVLLPQLGLVGAGNIKRQTCWEPASNRGYMARPLAEYFRTVIRSDIFPYGSDPICDFLLPGVEPASIAVGGAHWIITNPPFRLAEQFIERARAIKGWQGTAMFVRTSFLEGGDRYEKLFSKNPPTIVAQFAERVICTKGIVRDPNKEYFDDKTGEWKRPSTATSYCWLTWMDNADPRPMIWIPPCRRKLERSEDYVSCETKVPTAFKQASQDEDANERDREQLERTT